MTTLLLSGLALTAAVCASLTAAVIPLLRRARVIDVPGDRSLHKTPVPRGGGLAIVLSASLATWATVLAAVHRHDTVHSPVSASRSWGWRPCWPLRCSG